MPKGSLKHSNAHTTLVNTILNYLYILVIEQNKNVCIYQLAQFVISIYDINYLK